MPKLTKEEIKQARKDAGLTQREAASLCYKSLRMWQAYEGGETKMNPGIFELFLMKIKERAEIGGLVQIIEESK